MPGFIKVFTGLLLCLLAVACASHSITAPIDSRSNAQHSKPASRVTAHPAKAGHRYSSTRAGFHIVRRGESLYSISRKYNMGYLKLASINGIRPPYTIYKGQRLSLRGKARPAVVSTAVHKSAKSKAKRAPEVAVKKTKKPRTAKTGKPVKFDGVWKWPTRGRLLRGYKPNEPGKKGISIGGHSGQPVKAAARGKVVYVGSGLVGYGRLIIIRHNEKLLSTYGHNSELLVAEGAYVKAGQTIAKMGSSGTDHAELYFEIRKNGKPVNPLSYLSRKH